MRNSAALLCLAILGALSGATNAGSAKASWTVMVFMNGVNDLEPCALLNFRQLAAVGSTRDVQFVVELGRAGKSVEYGGWQGVYRFHVTRGLTPFIENSEKDPTFTDHAHVDMGDAATLSHFITWSESAYPASHYMLIVWDHGQGYRLSATVKGKSLAPSSSRLVAANLQDASSCSRASSNMSSEVSPSIMSISHDDRTGNTMFNAELGGALQSAGAKHVDILTFDACLMGMVEVAYAFRQVADVLVASEEDVPGPSWDYTYFSELTAKPNLTAFQLGRSLVQWYSRSYSHSQLYQYTTMSAYSLAGIAPAAKALDALTTALITNLSESRDLILATRKTLQPYDGGSSDYIDLVEFCRRLAQRAHEARIRRAAETAANAFDAYLLQNYASGLSKKESGSTGLAIYFPITNENFCDERAYFPGDPEKVPYPVQFVLEHQWASFLAALNPPPCQV